MSVEIKYNGSSISAGYGSSATESQPVPFFSESKEMIDIGSFRWGQRCNLTLDGQLTGRGNLELFTYDQSNRIPPNQPAPVSDTLTGHLENLVSRFNSNFKDLSIVEDGVEILNYPNCRVDSINFNESTMGSIIDYSISLSSYANFSGTFGVLDPVETISYSQQENGLINATLEISAKGFKTDSKDAFYNAKDFVLSRLPTASNAQANWDHPFPGFMGFRAGNPLRLSTTESIDRLNATYGVTENYLIDPNNTTTNVSGIAESYSVSWETGIELDEVTVSVEGTFRGGKELPFSDLRIQADNTAIGNQTLYKNAVAESKVTDLIEQPISKTVNEDAYNNTVSINATFTNNQLLTNTSLNGISKYGAVWYDPTVDFDYDNIKEKISVSISGPILTNVSLRKEKWNAIYDYLTNTIYTHADGPAGFIRNIANEVYTPLFGTSYPLHPEPLSLTVAMNENAGTIDLSATFDNRDFFHSQVSDIEYTVNVKPSLPIYSPTPAYNDNGYYIVYDINSKNREKISFQTNVKYATSGENDGKTLGLYNSTTNPNPPYPANWTAIGFNQGNNLLANLGNAWLLGNDTVLESESSNRNDQGRYYSVSQSFNQDQYNPSLTNEQTYIPINVKTG